MSRIDVTIDRLVLHGMEPASRKAFENGFRGELARILASPETRAAMAQSRRTPVLRLGKTPVEPGVAGARKLGIGVARAIGTAAKGTKR